MIAKNKNSKVVLRSAMCTEELADYHEAIAKTLKEISAWYWVNAIEGEEIDIDDWQDKLNELQDILGTQGEQIALFGAMQDVLLEQIADTVKG